MAPRNVSYLFPIMHIDARGAAVARVVLVRATLARKNTRTMNTPAPAVR